MAERVSAYLAHTFLKLIAFAPRSPSYPHYDSHQTAEFERTLTDDPEHWVFLWDGRVWISGKGISLPASAAGSTDLFNRLSKPGDSVGSNSQIQSAADTH